MKLVLSLCILAALIGGLFATGHGARRRSVRMMLIGALVAVAGYAGAYFFPFLT
jgi:hypothetical protein